MIARRAHAKINLCLSVAPPEPAGTLRDGRDVSGYHAIASWMSAIDLSDEIRVHPAPATSLHIAWADDAPRATPIDWPPEKDLAFRAHAALERKTGKHLPARIEVVKRIPVGAGLGGGSSDAAATLSALNELFELRLGAGLLRELAATLGSDVAFFVDNRETPRPALVTRLGDEVERVCFVKSDLVLVLPPFACETRAVYHAFDELLAERVERGEFGEGRSPTPGLARHDLVQRRIDKARSGLRDGLLFNDLYLPAVRVQPRLGELVLALSRATRQQAHVTGSGSGVFLVSNAQHADRLAERCREVARGLAWPEGPPAVLRSRLLGE